MRKMNVLLAISITLMLFSSIEAKAITIPEYEVMAVSDDVEATSERKMLEDIVYIEEVDELVLGFDPYLYLPFGFNPHAGMELDLDDIEYIEFDEDYF